MVFPTRHLQHTSLRLGIVALFMGLAVSAIDTVWSVTLDSFFHNMAIVGFITGVLSLLAVIFYFFSSPLLERYPQSKLWFFAACMTLLACILFALTNSAESFLAVAVLFVIMAVIRVETFGILLRDANKRSKLGAAEGTLYALGNIGWVLGPLFAGYVVVTYGNATVFVMAASFVAIAIILFLLIRFLRINHHTTDDGTLHGSMRNLKGFFSNRSLLNVYVLSGGISLYWGVVFIFLPLVIIRSGLGAHWIGIFLFAVSVPLVLLEYSIGQLADRYGCKVFFLIGYAVLTLAGLLAFFVLNVYVIMILFFLAGIGAACLEGTRETYFFKMIKKSEEEKYYGPYLTHIDVFSTTGKLLGALALAFFAVPYLFLLLAAEMFVFFIVASRVKD